MNRHKRCIGTRYANTVLQNMRSHKLYSQSKTVLFSDSIQIFTHSTTFEDLGSLDSTKAHEHPLNELLKLCYVA